MGVFFHGKQKDPAISALSGELASVRALIDNYRAILIAALERNRVKAKRLEEAIAKLGGEPLERSK
jgi:hypothetical protein